MGIDFSGASSGAPEEVHNAPPDIPFFLDDCNIPDHQNHTDLTVAEGEIYYINNTNFGIYDPVNNSYTPLSDRPGATDGCIQYGGDGYIYAFWGDVNEAPPGRSARYEISTDSWLQDIATHDITNADSTPGTEIIGDRIYFGTAGEEWIEYDMSSDTYTLLSAGPVDSGNCYVVFERGGYIYWVNNLSDLHRYDPDTDSWEYIDTFDMENGCYDSGGDYIHYLSRSPSGTGTSYYRYSVQGGTHERISIAPGELSDDSSDGIFWQGEPYFFDPNIAIFHHLSGEESPIVDSPGLYVFKEATTDALFENTPAVINKETGNIMTQGDMELIIQGEDLRPVWYSENLVFYKI